MPEVVLTPNLRRHVTCPALDLPGSTVREILDALFAGHPEIRGYVLDDQGALRHHMVIFVDGRQVQDRVHLGDPVAAHSEIYIMQALSGGACYGATVRWAMIAPMIAPMSDDE